MMQTERSTVVEKSPRLALICLFFAWKALLLIIALLGPGEDYDTSTQLMLDGYGIRNVHADSQTRLAARAGPITHRLVKSLARWDAIYFASTAERGYIHEQEWAFGWGFNRLLHFLSIYIPVTSSSLYDNIIHGIILAHAAHLLTTLILYQIVFAILQRPSKARKSLAFVAAALHVVSPAGIFLVAPYTEAPFALLNFLGHLLYIHSWVSIQDAEYGLQQDLALALSGICFGLSATIRGNGLLSGLLPFVDVVTWVAVKAERALQIRILSISMLPVGVQDYIRSIHSRRIAATIVAGTFTAVGFATPQYIAFREYCGGPREDLRPWCHKFPPSIYSWVQKHYWNVGFLKYWTLSNAPLFLIASPVLYMMLRSSWQALEGHVDITNHLERHSKGSQPQAAVNREKIQADALLFRLAFPQFALACAALTTFHVQVITRLSSGYPLWYIVLAQDVLKRRRTAQCMVRWFVMYALIQAVLFVKFLPPA